MMAEAFQATGNDLFKQRRFADALASYEQGLAIDQNNAVLLNNCAAVFIELGQYAAALGKANEALKVVVDEAYRPKIEARRLRALQLLELASYPKFDYALTPAVFFPCFEYFPVGHDDPQELICLSVGEYFLPDVKLLRDCLLEEDRGAPACIRVMLAASSDPRHILQTLSHIAGDVGSLCAPFGMTKMPESFAFLRPKIDLEAGSRSFNGTPLHIEIFVNDIVPETLARTVMLIVLVRCCGLAFVMEREEDIFIPYDYRIVFPDLPKSDHDPDSTFLIALLYHLWCSINLAPPFHSAYVALLKFLLQFSWEDSNHFLISGFEFAPGLLERFKLT